MLLREASSAQFSVRIGGAPLPGAIFAQFLEAVVENSLHLPDVCTLRFHDGDFKLIDSEIFDIGNRLQVFAGFERDALSPIFDGEIVSLEMELKGFGTTTILIKCLDKSHRLHRGRQARSWTNTKDSDVVKKICAEFGFETDIKETKKVQDWIFQNNQTNWEFMNELAARNGYRLNLDGYNKLSFRPISAPPKGSEIKLEWGETLRSFRPRVNASAQVDEVIVRSWDPKQKKPIIGKARKADGVPVVGLGNGPDLAGRAFGPAKMVVCDRPVHSDSEAEMVAQSICDELGGTFLEADGVCVGNPKLKAGAKVSITNIGKRFSGTYFVTSSVHTYSATEGFSTLFTVSGKQSDSLLSILDRDGLAKKRALGGNIVVGIVTDNKDPEGLNRVKVKYPWMTEDHTSFWARTATQMGGKGRGFFNLPEIEDEVLVAFEHGDVNRPYVLGQLWNGKDRPPGTNSKDNNNPVHGPGSSVNRRGFQTRIGHQLDFDDTGGKGKIMIKTAGGHVINVDDAGKKVDITTTGGHKFSMEDAGKKIAIKSTAGQSVTVDDGGSKVSVKDNGGDNMLLSQGFVTFKAATTIDLGAPVVNFVASAAINAIGITVSAKGDKGLAASAGGMLSGVSGSILSINAAKSLRMETMGKAELQGKGGVSVSSPGPVEVKAAMININ
jgi:phage protein D